MARLDYLDDPDAPAANSIVPAVSVIASRGESILLIHRSDNDYWALPGGRVELGETISDAATRETLEETGVTVRVTGLVGVYSNPNHVSAFDDGEVRQQFSICVHALPVSGDPRPSDESVEARFVPTASLDHLAIHPSIRLRISHHLQRREQPYLD